MSRTIRLPVSVRSFASSTVRAKFAHTDFVFDAAVPTARYPRYFPNYIEKHSHWLADGPASKSRHIELMHFLHELPSTIQATPLTVVLQLQSNMHFLHIAFN